MITQSSHFWTAEQVGKYEPHARRMVALLLWFFSLVGTMIAVGGWPLRADAGALAAALFWQALCTAIQFISCRRWSSPLYLVALGASVVPSYMGYAPLVEGPIRAALTLGTTLPDYGIGLLTQTAIAVALIAVDVIPERVFIRH